MGWRGKKSLNPVARDLKSSVARDLNPPVARDLNPPVARDLKSSVARDLKSRATGIFSYAAFPTTGFILLNS